MNIDSTVVIIQTVLRHYPDVQGVYLFGSYGTEDERADSDVDLALLLPAEQAKSAAPLEMSPCRFELAEALGRDVDLVNLRRVSTVFRKEIVFSGRLLYGPDRFAIDEFEMLTLSFYQKLNQERAEILAEGLRTGRFYDV